MKYLQHIRILYDKTPFLIVRSRILPDRGKVILELTQRGVKISSDPFADHLKTDGSLDDGIIVSILTFIRQLHEYLASIPAIFIHHIDDMIINSIENLIQTLPFFRI